MAKKDLKKEINNPSTALGASKKAFTLIETLVAIFILTVAVTGPMSAAQSSLKASFLARDQVVAYYLAQDAIEGIKNLKDKKALNGDDWLDIVPSNCINGSDGTTHMQCNFNSYDNEDWDVCGDDQNILQCDYMKLENGIYKYDSSEGDNSRFKRSVFLYETVSNPDEIEVNVIVEWRTNLFLTDKRIKAQENIYNWILAAVS